MDYTLKWGKIMVKLQYTTRKNGKGEFLICISEAEIGALGWEKGEHLNKCIRNGRLVITSLKVSDGGK